MRRYRSPTESKRRNIGPQYQEYLRLRNSEAFQAEVRKALSR